MTLLNLDKLYKFVGDQDSVSDTYSDPDGYPELNQMFQRTLSSYRIVKAPEQQSGLPSAHVKRNDTPVDGSRYIRRPGTTF